MRIDHLRWGVAGSAALALVGQGIVMRVFISMALNAPDLGLATRWGLAIRTFVLPEAPFMGLLIALLLAGLLRWSLLFPWGLLAVPWLSYESVRGFITGLNPVWGRWFPIRVLTADNEVRKITVVLAGPIPIGALMAGIGELLLVLLLVSGSVLWWKRR